MLRAMRTIILLVALAGQLRLGLSQAPRYECTPKVLDGEEFCEFSNVRQPAADATFGSPSGAAKPSRIAFKDSSMEHLPRNFLQQFSTDLKVLDVEGCQLKSVTVTNGLEILRAGNNAISKVVVHQSGEQSVLRELDLSGNKINNFQNITRCQNLEVLNLSGNSGILGEGGVLDLSDFGKLQKLKELYLSNLGMNYLDNTKKTSLDSLVLLDLSRNNLIPSDLRMEVFYPFKKLETLRLNDNNMAQLDYNLLLKIENLKTVYLNGNSFACTYIKTMLDHLKKEGLTTPTEIENYDCRSQQNKYEDMCCTGPSPPGPTPTPGPFTPTPTPVTPVAPSTKTPDVIPVPVTPDGKVDPSADKDSLPWIIGVIVGVLLAAAAAVAGFFVYKKKQSAAANINGESSVALRSH